MMDPAEERSRASLASTGSVRGRHEEVIRGIPVRFPFEPYNVQRVYMAKVFEALEKKDRFALLESPTGTGKSLNLLVSLLAWQQEQRSRLRQAQQRVNSVDPLDKLHPDKIPETPLIIYASRTHSQLNQVVQELKRTVYRPRMAVLTSRVHTCVNPEVRSRGPGEIRHLCRQLTKQKACGYLDKVERFISGTGFANEDYFIRETDNPNDDRIIMKKNLIMDIEELTQRGKRNGVCPYFLSRDKNVQERADMIFMPYNYLVDADVRQSLEIRWNGAVIVVDEAHNLEKTCDEATSFSLSVGDLSMAIEEVDEAVARARESPASLPADLSLEKIASLKELILRTEQALLNTPLINLSIMGGSTGKVMDGERIFDYFAALHEGHRDSEVQAFLALFKSLEEFHGRATHLEKYTKAFTRALSKTGKREPDEQAKLFYKTFIREERPQWGGGPTQTRADPKMRRILNFWCFSPGVALAELQAKGVYNIILTSGTLSPLGSFAAQMRAPFPIRLENPHVISNEQIYVGVVPKGPTGKQLLSTYQNRESTEYLSDLGNAITNFVRMIPDGVLVFFPSYYIMEICVRAWRGNGILDRIQKHKVVVQEAKTASEMNAVVVRYENLIEKGKGAIFFAVCRGKASEGIDFANSKARGVIITGLPFPPKNDPKVVLKKEFLNRQRPDPSRPNEKLSGNDWYVQEAYRAVNQAIGRVIRHKDDYGAVLLCDSRFQKQEAQNSLSFWLRDKIKVCHNFGLATRDLTAFFKTNVAKRGMGHGESSVLGKKRIELVYENLSSSSSQSVFTLPGPKSSTPYLEKRRRIQQVGKKMKAGPAQRIDLTELLQRKTTKLDFGDEKVALSKETQKIRLEEQRQKVEQERREKAEAAEIERARSAEVMSKKRKRKRLEDEFRKGENKKLDAKKYMEKLEHNVKPTAFNTFKSSLRNLKKVISGRYDDEEVATRAQPLFKQIISMLKQATNGMEEQFLVAFSQFLPNDLKPQYQSLVLKESEN